MACASACTTAAGTCQLTWRWAREGNSRSEAANLRSCGSRPRSSCSPAIASPCATGPSSRRWPGPSCSILTRRGWPFVTRSDSSGWSASRSTARSAAPFARSLDDPVQFVAAHVARDVAVRPSSAFVKTRFGQPEIDAAAGQLIQAGTVVIAEGVLAQAGAWTRAVQRSADLVDETHRAHPELAGLSLTELRNTLKKEFPFDEIFDALVASLCERGFSRSGSVVHRPAHRAQLPEPLRAAGDGLRRALAAQPLEPPSRKQLAPDAASQRALRFLIESGEVVEISSELVMSAASAAQVPPRRDARVCEVLGEAHGPATVSELRQSLGASRRIVVPLLEYLDRTFVTLRQGDKRTLR